MLRSRIVKPVTRLRGSIDGILVWHRTHAMQSHTSRVPAQRCTRTIVSPVVRSVRSAQPVRPATPASGWTRPQPLVAPCRAQAKTQTVEQQTSKPTADPWAKVVEQEQKGETVEVVVKRSNKGGLIVELGELEGFLPYTQLSPLYMRKGHLGDMSYLHGRKLKAKIISVDMQSGRRGLVFSERRYQQSLALERLKRGDVVRGRVSKVEEYGVFVNLLDLPGVKGLVHRTEISWDPVAINDIRYQRGDLVQVMVVDADSAKSRLSLSIKQLTPDPLKQTLDTLPWGPTSSVPPEIQVIVDKLDLDPQVDKVVVTRQAQDPHHVTQELQVFLTRESDESSSSASGTDTRNSHTVVARLGTVLQEMQVVTGLSRNQVKTLLQTVVSANK